MKIDVSYVLAVLIVYFGLIVPFFRFAANWQPKTPHRLRAVAIALFILPLSVFGQKLDTIKIAINLSKFDAGRDVKVVKLHEKDGKTKIFEDIFRKANYLCEFSQTGIYTISFVQSINSTQNKQLQFSFNYAGNRDLRVIKELAMTIVKK